MKQMFLKYGKIKCWVKALQRINDQFWWYVGENKIEQNKNWQYTPDHPYRIFRKEGWGSGKTNMLLNLIEN